LSKVRKLEPHRTAASLDTPTDLSEAAVREISAALNALVADTFALYVKTKNFHWHTTGSHFRDYHRASPQGRRHHDPLDWTHRKASKDRRQ
jgi:starvation-inducible DNA-binding protein